MTSLVRRFAGHEDEPLRHYDWLWSLFMPVVLLVVGALLVREGSALQGAIWLGVAILVWAGTLGTALLDGWPGAPVRPWRSDDLDGSVRWGQDEGVTTDSVGVRDPAGECIEWDRIVGLRVRAPVHRRGTGAIRAILAAIGIKDPALIEFEFEVVDDVPRRITVGDRCHYDVRVQRALDALTVHERPTTLSIADVLQAYLDHHRDQPWYLLWRPPAPVPRHK